MSLIYSRVQSFFVFLDRSLFRVESNPAVKKVFTLISRRDASGIVSPSGTAWQLFKIVTVVMAVCVVAGLVIPGLKIGSAFGEGDLMTWFSFFALIAAGRISDRIWKLRGSRGKEEDSFVWRVLSVFFTYLAFDELLRIHETIDNLTHRVLGIKPTNLTDHLDDAIIGLYGVIGIFIIIKYLKELLNYLCAIKYFVMAAVCAVGTVALDFLCSSKPFLRSLLTDPDDVQLVIDALDVFEEWFKVYSEIFFICAFLAALAAAGRQMIVKLEFSDAGAPVNDLCAVEELSPQPRAATKKDR